MNNYEIKDEIIRLLEKVIEKTNEINRRHPSEDMLMEIDLVKDDLRRLYRSFEDLGKVAPGKEEESLITENHRNTSHPESKETTEEKVKEEPAEEEVKEAVTPPQGETRDEKQEKQEKQEAAGEKKEEEPIREEKQEIARPPIDHKPPVETEKPAEGNGNKAVIDILSEYTNHTIGDQYIKDEDDSLHNRISGQKEEKSIGTRMQQKPIENLKEVIGVNEKFLFINELFNGNIQDYHNAVAKLNSMQDVKQAFDYLNALGIDYSWDANRSASTIEKLANYVQRRYMHL